MSKIATIPYSRKHKTSAVTGLFQVAGPKTTSDASRKRGTDHSFDSAFLADRGCFRPVFPKRKRARTVPMEQRRRA